MFEGFGRSSTIQATGLYRFTRMAVKKVYILLTDMYYNVSIMCIVWGVEYDGEEALCVSSGGFWKGNAGRHNVTSHSSRLWADGGREGERAPGSLRKREPIFPPRCLFSFSHRFSPCKSLILLELLCFSSFQSAAHSLYSSAVMKW